MQTVEAKRREGATASVQNRSLQCADATLGADALSEHRVPRGDGFANSTAKDTACGGLEGGNDEEGGRDLPPEKKRSSRYVKKVEGLPNPLSSEVFRCSAAASSSSKLSSASSSSSETIDSEAFLRAARLFLIDSASRPCRKAHRNCAKCLCLRDIASPEWRLNDAASFVLDHARRSKGERQVVLKEWMRQAELIRAERGAGMKRRPCYPVAGVWREAGEELETAESSPHPLSWGRDANDNEVRADGEDDSERNGGKATTIGGKRGRPPKNDDKKRKRGDSSAINSKINPSGKISGGRTPYYVCQFALMRLCDVGLHQFKSLLRDKSNPAPLVHGLAGKRPNSCDTAHKTEGRMAVRAFLLEEVTAAKRVGCWNNTTTAGGDVNVDDDGDFAGRSVRALYEQFCHRRGYVLQRDKDGSYGRMEDYEEREHNDTDWPPGSVPLPVLSKDAFDAVYNEVFPKAKERRRREAVKAEEDRKKRTKDTERLLRAERRERERERLRHDNIRGELERQLERERVDHARERDVMLREVTQLKGRVAELEQMLFAYSNGNDMRCRLSH
uniref:Uncharacterized protein n=1 Tax=Odontella aurita TaxID=265563 RepID=A0A7S4M984_9STRA|mmetsp:Transcript_15174/g.44026  ORF Transcript_15174/g.44026 Transcript_15174/m.44026 type:complete len:559 (+) Transcript_15174:53-1729(+)